jgi:single-stranded-DNA-specific exonuclease
VLAELDREPALPAAGGVHGAVHDRRGGGVAGTIAALVASGEPVLVVCADVPRRLAGLAERLGGFALCSYGALERDPALAAGYAHVVGLDPPAHAFQRASLTCLAWGDPELRFAQHVFTEAHDLRPALEASYRTLRAGPQRLEDALPRSPVLAGRVLRVLGELGLVVLDRESFTAHVPPPRRSELAASAAYRAYEARRSDGERWLSSAIPVAA